MFTVFGHFCSFFDAFRGTIEVCILDVADMPNRYARDLSFADRLNAPDPYDDGGYAVNGPGRCSEGSAEGVEDGATSVFDRTTSLKTMVASLRRSRALSRLARRSSQAQRMGWLASVKAFVRWIQKFPSLVDQGWSAVLHRRSKQELAIIARVAETLTAAGVLLFVPVIKESTRKSKSMTWPLSDGTLVDHAMMLQLWALTKGDAGKMAGFMRLCMLRMYMQLWTSSRSDELASLSALNLERIRIASLWMGTTRMIVQRYAPATLAMLGRWPEATRWLALDGHYGSLRPSNGDKASSTDSLMPNSLNWTTLRQARSSAKLRRACLPPHLQWGELMGTPCPKGMRIPSLEGFKVGVFNALGQDLRAQREANDAVALPIEDGTNLQPLVNLVKLFGDAAAVRRFTEKSQGLPWGLKTMHDAGQFVLPAAGWTPAKWAPLCARHPQSVVWAEYFTALEALGVFPTSWQTLNTAVRRLGYPDIEPKWEALAELCMRHKISGASFKRQKAFWEVAPVKTAEFVPPLNIQGEGLGLDRAWRLERLSATDPLGTMLGELTGCCQHLGSSGRACAEHGVISPYSGFWAVFRHETVVAQSWVWLTDHGELVIDSIETRERDEATLATIFALYDQAVRTSANGVLGPRDVFLGNTLFGITKKYADHRCSLCAPRVNEGVLDAQRFGKTSAGLVSSEPADRCTYYDGEVHRLIEVPRVLVELNVPLLPEVAGYVRAEGEGRPLLQTNDDGELEDSMDDAGGIV